MKKDQVKFIAKKCFEAGKEDSLDYSFEELFQQLWFGEHLKRDQNEKEN